MVPTDEKPIDLDVFSAVQDLGPKELIQFLEQCAVLLPEEVRFRLRETIRTVPREGDALQRVLELVRRQWEGLQSREPIQIALVGPARTGKQSLVEAIEGAAVHPLSSMFMISDVQGLDEFLGYQRRPGTPEEVSGADVILLVLDAHYHFTEDTERIVARLSQLEKPFLVVLNKIDLAEKPRRVVMRAKQQLGVPVIPVSSFQRRSVDRLLKAIIAACPRAVHPLARALPRFRRTLCSGVVTQAAFGSGLAGAIPIPVSDIFPISAIQVAMVLKLASIYGLRIDRGRAKELVPLLAAGALVREGGHRLRQRYPEHKRLIAIGVGGLWTYLIGQAAIRYFEKMTDAFGQPATA